MKRTSFVLPSLLAALLGATGLVACSDGNVFELAVGDCFDEAADSEGGEISDVPLVECDEPHDYEVFAATDYDGDDYPGQLAMEEYADEVCYGAFESYVGTAYEQSALYYSHFTPSTGSWATGDREVTCMLFEVDDAFEPVKLESSMRGSSR